MKTINLLKTKGVAFWKRHRTLLTAVMVVALTLVLASGSVYAQTPGATSTPALALDTDMITTQLFEGANIIIGALGVVMFLIAGISFGGRVMRYIVDAVTNFRI